MSRPVPTWEAIPYRQCLTLLRSADAGRLGVVVGGQPDIFPVNYVVDGSGVVFRTDDGAKLRGALAGPVAFEVDDLGCPAGPWSVVIHGTASLITRFDSAALRQAFRRLTTSPWVQAGEEKAHLVRITPESVTGRRAAAAAVSPTRPPAGPTPRS